MDCLCTQKKFNVGTFSQAQTGLRGEIIRVFNLLLAYDLNGRLLFSDLYHVGMLSVGEWLIRLAY